MPWQELRVDALPPIGDWGALCASDQAPSENLSTLRPILSSQTVFARVSVSAVYA